VRALRRDDNEDVLLETAYCLGMHFEPCGPLDGWILYRRIWLPVEIKNPKGRNRYTPRQLKFIERCKNAGVSVHTWRTEQDVIHSANTWGN